MADSEEYDTLYIYGMRINNVYLWIVFALGFPGNIASLTALSKMKSASAPVLYMVLLAVADSLSIFMKLLYHQLTLRKVEMGPAACKTLNFFTLVFATYANWLIVFMAAERSEAIANFFRTKSNGRRVLMHCTLLAIMVLGIYLHLFWMFTDLDGIHCGIYERYVPFYVGVWYWICATVYTLAPTFLLVIIDVVIICRLRQMSDIVSDVCPDHGTTGPALSRYLGQETSSMILAVAVAFVVMTMPRCLCIILETQWSYQFDTLSHAQKHLINQITFVLSDARHAINFYLFVFSSRKFRSSIGCSSVRVRKDDNSMIMLTQISECTGKENSL